MNNYNYKFDRKLIFLIGNIGSGKTTYTTNIKKDYVVLSRDKIRYMLGGGDYVFNPLFEPALWKGISEIFTQLIKTEVNIIIDEVNVNYVMRTQYLNIIHNMHEYIGSYHITGVVFPKLSKKEAIKRRLSAPHGNIDQKQWERVYTRFNKLYEEPSLSEGFHKIIWLKNCQGQFKIRKQIGENYKNE